MLKPWFSVWVPVVSSCRALNSTVKFDVYYFVAAVIVVNDATHFEGPVKL